MDNNLVKRATAAVDVAIKSSKDHFAKLKTATVLATLLLADGRGEQFNRLFNEVTAGDAESIRLFLRNLKSKFGWTEMSENGKEIERSPFKVSKDGAKAIWSLAKDSDARKASCKAILDGGEEALSELNFSSVKTDDRGREEKDFNLQEAISTLLLKAAKKGASMGEIASINKVLDKPVPKAELEAAATATETALEKAQKRVANLQKIVASRKAETTTETPEQTKKAA